MTKISSIVRSDLSYELQEQVNKKGKSVVPFRANITGHATIQKAVNSNPEL